MTDLVPFIVPRSASALMKSLCVLLLLGFVTRGRCAPGGRDFHVYAPSHTTGKLLVARATPSSGGLELTLAQEVKLGFPASVIAKHPTMPLLYVAPPQGPEGQARGAVITLQADGSYMRHTEVNFSHPYAYISLDRTSRFLLGADYEQGFVDVYALEAEGMVGRRVAALNEGSPHAHCILTSPDNRFAYVPYVKENNAIFQYRFDAGTGGLMALAPKNANPPAGTGPRHMAYHPTLPILYFSNEQQLGVSAYTMEPSGQLKLRQICDAVSQDTPKDGVSSSDIVITPDGKFLFAGLRGHSRPFDWISRYRVKASGELELLGLTPADQLPWGLALSPDGRHLLAAAFEGATLCAYHIAETGELTKAASLTWEKQIFCIVSR